MKLKCIDEGCGWESQELSEGLAKDTLVDTSEFHLSIDFELPIHLQTLFVIVKREIEMVYLNFLYE